MKNFIKNINFKKLGGVVPAVIQDDRTQKVLMVGFMNAEALKKTQKERRVWFYSRSRQRLWLKGEKSENYLNLVSIKLDCDSDTLLLKVTPEGATCHNGDYSCFKEKKEVDNLASLFDIITSRKKNLPKKSYTASLFRQGLDKICLKVAEESLEVVQAATKETRQRLIEESADLIYHLFVLLAEKDLTLNDIQAELRKKR